MSSRQSHRLLKIALVVPLIFSALYFSKATFGLAEQQLNHSNELLSPDVNQVNPFASKVLSKNSVNRLEDVAEAKRRLSFMTFATDRKREARVVLAWLKTQLNQRPFDAALWGELVSIQADAQSDPMSRVWAAKSALTVGGWNHNYRLRITAQCLERPAVLLKADNHLCPHLLANLPHSDMPSNARGMGIHTAVVQQRIAELQAEFDLTRHSLED